MDRRIGAWMAAIGVGVGLTAAAPARAGSYTVYACGTPAGKFTNHSWALEVAGPATQFRTGTCSDRDARPNMFLSSEANKTYDAGWSASMTFRAPAQTTIADFSIHRYLFQFNPVDNYPGRDYLFDVGQLGPTPFELTGHHSASGSIDPAHWYGSGEAAQGEATVTRAGLPALAGYKGDATYLRYTIGCQAAQGCALSTNGRSEAGAIVAQVFGASVTLSDPTMPAITEVAQSGLRAPGAVGGDEPVTFDATDNTGIKSAQLVDVTPGSDPKVVGQLGLTCDYSYAAPCPQAAGARVAASGLPPGRRQLKLRITDAGNNVTDSDAFAVDVGGPANGTGAAPQAKLTASFARGRRGTLTLGFGKRATIKGRLTTAAGAPIADATLQVLDRELRTGTSYRQRLEVTTGADGRFSVLAGKGAARAIRFEYRWRRLLAQPDVARRVELRVQAGATLSISPRRVRAGGRIRIAGRLRGLPLPRSGKVVELQAFDGGKWRTFRSTRARGSGRFATSYRFQRAARGSSFLIRARVRRDDSYPYYLGYSPRVRVRVR